MLPNNMKNDIVVGRIVLMTMTQPIRGVHMYLYIASPMLVIYDHLGMEEVRTCLMVVFSGFQYLKPQTAGSFQICGSEFLVFPNEMKKVFSHSDKIKNPAASGIQNCINLPGLLPIQEYLLLNYKRCGYLPVS